MTNGSAHHRPRTWLHDYGRMAVVGALGVALDFGTFNLLLRAGVHANAANAVALTLAALATFRFNLVWTFGNRDITDRWSAFARFVLVTVSSILLVELGVALVAARSVDPIALNAAKGVLTVVAAGFRFVLYRHWVYVVAPGCDAADPGPAESGQLTGQTNRPV